VHRVKFGGVLNGVDYDVWNPEIDPFIPARYSIDSIDRKYESKRRLRERLWLRDTWSPIVACVGRLDEQKGMHLVHHALFHTLARGGQFVLHGNGFHEQIAGHFWHLKDYLNEHPDCHLEIGYSEPLAHLIYAGADLLIAPSLFEPCGLAPMIALRYGNPCQSSGRSAGCSTPCSTATTRSHGAQRVRVPQRRQPSDQSALDRALGLWFDYPHEFRALMINGMQADHSWARPGQDYLDIYEHIRHK